MITDYAKYRGKCKELAEAAVIKDTSLRLVRGHYFCPIWNREEPHWWAEKEDGEIVDPTAKQFPSKGHGIYTEFNGEISCAECGRIVLEEEAHINGNYACCSYECAMRLVGL